MGGELYGMILFNKLFKVCHFGGEGRGVCGCRCWGKGVPGSYLLSGVVWYRGWGGKGVIALVGAALVFVIESNTRMNTAHQHTSFHSMLPSHW